MERTKNHEPTEEEWREPARRATTEEDPDKMLSLCEQIVEAYEDEKRKTMSEPDPVKLPQRVADAS